MKTTSIQKIIHCAKTGLLIPLIFTGCGVKDNSRNQPETGIKTEVKAEGKIDVKPTPSAPRYTIFKRVKTQTSLGKTNLILMIGDISALSSKLTLIGQGQSYVTDTTFINQLNGEPLANTDKHFIAEPFNVYFNDKTDTGVTLVALISNDLAAKIDRKTLSKESLSFQWYGKEHCVEFERKKVIPTPSFGMPDLSGMKWLCDLESNICKVNNPGGPAFTGWDRSIEEMERNTNDFICIAKNSLLKTTVKTKKSEMSAIKVALSDNTKAITLKANRNSIDDFGVKTMTFQESEFEFSL